MDIHDRHPNLAEWIALIEGSLADPESEPILNVAHDPDPVYDAIFVGGGAAGSALRTCGLGEAGS